MSVMVEYLDRNPHPLGTRECLLAEKERHDNTAFGSYHDRFASYDRITKALTAWMNEARKKFARP